MDNTEILATWREVLEILSNGDFPNRRTVLILIVVLVVNPMIQWQMSRPDCLSIQVQKSQIAANLYPACEQGYCDGELFSKYTNNIIYDALHCNQRSVELPQSSTSIAPEPAGGGLRESPRRNANQRQLWT